MRTLRQRGLAALTLWLAPAALAEPPFSCGSAVCGAGTFCEFSDKGHALDDEGRPLPQYRCEPLPVECTTAPPAPISSGFGTWPRARSAAA